MSGSQARRRDRVIAKARSEMFLRGRTQAMKSKEILKSRELLLVGVFAVSLLVLMIGVIIGSRASPPPGAGAVPPDAISAAALALQGGGARLDYYPPAP